MRIAPLFLLFAVHLAAQEHPPIWRLSPEPALRLGGPDATGPSEFSNPYDATFWGNRLVVLDGATQTLRIFSLRDGRYLATFGRKGAGPGEYSNAAYLQPLPGDSLFVSDLQQSRYTLLDSAGHVATVVSLAALRVGTRTTPLGRLADGSILAWATRFDAAAGPGPQPIRVTILRVSPDGRHADSLRVLPFTTVQPMNLGGGRGWRVVLGAGQLQPAVAPTKAYFNSPTRYLLYVLGAGNTWTTLEQPLPPRLSRPSDAEAIRKRAVDHGASPTLMATVGIADTLPAIAFAKLSPSGRLFVLDGQVDSVGQHRGVTVFSAGGKPEARFYFPSSLMLLAVSDSQVVLTEHDPDEAPSILVYDLVQ
jgi:hypothetical protein